MKICFVPFFEKGNVFRYNGTYFFDDFMLSIELMIIKYFSEIKNHDFTVKSLKGTVYSEILMDFIKKNKYPNIYYQDGKLNMVLKKCDLAIIDFPSSSIIEVNKANIPTLVLSYDALSIRQNALKQYRNIENFQYKNPQEVLNTISEFINNNS